MHLLYFAPVVWDSYEQRPHYVLRHFLASGGREATWVNPYGARLAGLRDIHRIGVPRSRLRLERPQGLTVMDITGWPIDPLPGGAALNARAHWHTAFRAFTNSTPAAECMIGIGRPTAMALEALEAIPHRSSFYDAMDDFPEFYRGLSRRRTREVEQKIAGRVDVVYTSSTALHAKFAPGPRPVRLMRNAYDMSLLRPVRDRDRTTLPVGFLGCLGGWIDWLMISRVAEALRPRRVVLVGPSPVPVPRALPDNIDRRPECHQAETVEYLDTFAAGLIPFTRTRLTESIDPIKYYQYRGAGLPVLTTRFGEMAIRNGEAGTFFLEERNETRAIEAALSYRASSTEIDAFRQRNNWTERFAEANLFAGS